MWLAREMKLPATTLSPAQSGNELKPAIALGSGNAPRCPLHTRASTGIVLTARGSGPLHRWHPRFSPRLQTLTTARGTMPVALTRSNTARDGAPWSILTATALMKLDIREGFLWRHSAANPANTRRGTITAGVLLCPREAEARQRTLSLTRTSRTRRPARAGSTCCHATHPAETMMPSWTNTSATTMSTRIPRTNLTSRSRVPRILWNLNP